MSIDRTAGIVAGGLVALAISGAAFAQQQAPAQGGAAPRPPQVSGQIGTGAPEEVFLNMKMAADGVVSLSSSAIKLAWGGYYRFNFVCPPGMADGMGVVMYAPELWENSHIRIISVADTTKPIEDPQANFYMQGRNISKLECEGLDLTLRVSFHPMRKGTYPFRVVNERTNPPKEVKGQFIVE
ncbi:MAG: hypothetical protein U1E56_01610 [Bauldia sp.]